METGSVPLQVIEWNQKELQIHDKEMLAIIWGLENWRHLLEDACFKFEIWTDHKNLEYFYEGAEVESQTSLMGTLPVKIWLYFKACPRNKNGKSR